MWEAEASGGFLVALKFVHLSNRARAAELRALDFVRGIHHPNLLANFGSWLVDDTLIIGMELADRSLWDRLVEAVQQGYRGIPRGELLGYLAEVAAGVDHLNGYRHTFEGRTSIGVQHRDLKPPNLLLFGGGAKVADLGMARAMEGEIAGHTGIWTFPYAAPEFFRGETTRHSDQYGLAATFCQLRGGRLPFGGNAASVTAGHLFARPNLEALPDPERPIVERALAKVPGDRWPSCRAFVDALRALPADAVADILIDPNSSSSISLEFQSSAGGGSANFLTGSTGSGSGAMDSGWPQHTLSTGSTFDSAFRTRPSVFASSPPTTGAGLPRSPDFVPTLVLPALANGPPLQVTPQPARRPARSIQVALAAVATALVLTIIAIPSLDPNEKPPATPVLPNPIPAAVPAPEMAASMGPAPSVEAPPALVAPTEATAGTRNGKPESEPAPSLPQLSLAEPVGPAAVPTLPLAGAESPPASVVPPGARDIRSAPALIARDRLDLVPEGPIEMLVPEGPIEMADTAPKALSPLPERRVSEPARPASPLVVAPRPDAAAPLPLAASAMAKAVHPPVPDRSIPALAPRPVALDGPSSPGELARNLGPTRTPLLNRGNPAAAEAAYARGRDFFLKNSFAEAATEFDESIRLNPGHVTSYLVRAIARHRAGDPRMALADYSEVIRARPDDVIAYISRGQAHHELGDHGRAIADYDEAIRRQPNDGDAHFRRGLTRYKSGDYAGAVADFTETLRLDRNNAYAAEFRAEALARRDAKTASPANPRTDPDRPATMPASVVSSLLDPPIVTPVANPPGVDGVARTTPAPGGTAGSSPIRATGYLAPPPSTSPPPTNTAAGVKRPRDATPATRPAAKPNPAERRRAPVRRLLPWPFSKPK